MDEKKNEQLPIGPDSPERAMLDELVSILNALIKGASSRQKRSALESLKDILGACLSVPPGVRGRIQSQYRKVCQQPGVIEENILKELKELGAKVDVSGGYEDGLRRLISYSRSFIEAQMQASTDSPEAHLRAEAEALVASSPFRNAGILNYFKELWGSGTPEKLDYSTVRKGFNTYWQESEDEKARLEAEEARLKKEEEETRIRMEAEAKEAALRKQAEKAGQQRVPTEKEVPATPEKTNFVGRGTNEEPSRARTLREKIPARSNSRKTIRELNLKGKTLTEAHGEKTIVLQMLFDLEYDVLLEGLNPPRLEIGDVIYCESADGFPYEFKVKAKAINSIGLEGINDRFAGLQLFITDEAIRLNGAIKFVNNVEGIDEIKKLTVSKKPALAVREEHETKDKGDFIFAALGDSHGNFAAFKSNLDQAKIIDCNGHWKCGKGKVVIHGDILADRQAEGFKILDHIRVLRAEAKQAGGDVVVLAGNHEDFMISFLLGKQVIVNPPFETEEGEIIERMDPFDICAQGLRSSHGAQGTGLLELTQFTGDKKMIEGFIDVLDVYDERLGEALPAMRKDSEGKRLLEEMCQMKLCERIDDVVFVHTDPTNEMLEAIMDTGIDKINGIFQGGLRKSLIDGAPLDSNCSFLIDTFLNTGNRTFDKIFSNEKIRKRLDCEPNLRKDLLLRLKKEGVNDVVFGHSDLGHKNRTILLKKFGVTFYNVDQGAGKYKGEKIKAASVLIRRLNSKGKKETESGTRIFNMNAGAEDKK